MDFYRFMDYLNKIFAVLFLLYFLVSIGLIGYGTFYKLGFMENYTSLLFLVPYFLCGIYGLILSCAELVIQPERSNIFNSLFFIGVSLLLILTAFIFFLLGLDEQF